MITGTLTLVEETCNSCGTHFAVDNFLIAQLRINGKSFYCPNGHSLYFGESEAEKLRKENKRLKNESYWVEKTKERLAVELGVAKTERANARRKLTITQNRIANGVCPCCNRSFTNIARHMVSKHPDFKKAVE